MQANGATPVFVAAQFGHAAAIDRLVKAKCDVEQAAVRDLPGAAPLASPAPSLASLPWTLLPARCTCAVRGDGLPPSWPRYLHLTQLSSRSRARRGGRRKVRAERSERRRLTAMSPLPLQNDTETPLGIAAFKGHVEAVRALRAAGANKRVHTKWGTALEQARNNERGGEEK